VYDLIDRPIADLPAADASLLRATRAWVHQLTMAGAADAETAGGDALDGALRALDAGSTEVIAFERPCAALVSETEAVWLGIGRLVRADRLAPARTAIETMADAATARAVIAGLIRAA
jgi:hypothetical protein